MEYPGGPQFGGQDYLGSGGLQGSVGSLPSSSSGTPLHHDNTPMTTLIPYISPLLYVK